MEEKVSTDETSVEVQSQGTNSLVRAQTRMPPDYFEKVFMEQQRRNHFVCVMSVACLLMYRTEIKLPSLTTKHAPHQTRTQTLTLSHGYKGGFAVSGWKIQWRRLHPKGRKLHTQRPNVLFCQTSHPYTCGPDDVGDNEQAHKDTEGAREKCRRQQQPLLQSVVGCKYASSYAVVFPARR